MPKNISDKDLYPNETLLPDRHDGWRIGEIEQALECQGLSFNRRTLQRRLIRLEKGGRIRIAGVGRATRYLPVVAAERSTEANGGIFLLLSAKGLVPENDREHFLKIAREEIAALHEGNYARYRLRPSEFKA